MEQNSLNKAPLPLNINNNSLKRYKKICIYFLDLLCMFFTGFLLFLLGYEIFINSNACRNINQNITDYGNHMAEIYEEAGLSYRYEFEENTYLKNPGEISEEFVKGSLLTKLKLMDNALKDDEYFNDISPIDVTNDRLFNYYFSYLPTHLSAYDQTEASPMNKETFINKFFLNIGNENFNYFVVENDYYVVSDTYINDFINKYSEDPTSIKSDFTRIKNGYEMLLKQYTDHFEQHHMVYAQTLADYNHQYDVTNYYILTILFSTYFVSIAVFFVVIPTCLKEGRTLFMKLFRLTCRTTNDKEVTIGNNLIRGFTCFLLFIFLPAFYSLIPLGYPNGFYLLVQDFLGIFNLFALGTLTLIFTICSLLFTLFSQRKRQTFSEAFASIVVYEDKRKQTIKINGQEVEIS